MATIFLGTQIDSGNIDWRAKTLPQPADRLLVLEYRGNLSAVQGVSFVNNRWQVDVDRLRAAYPLFCLDWMPAAGSWVASVQSLRSSTVVSVQF